MPITFIVKPPEWKAFLERAGNSIEIACRPSDVFATTVRVDAAIFVAEEVLMKVGITTDKVDKMDGPVSGEQISCTDHQTV